MFDKRLVDTIDINLEEAKIHFMDKRWNDYLSLKDNNKSIETLNTLIKDRPNNFILLADRGLCYFLI